MPMISVMRTIAKKKKFFLALFFMVAVGFAFSAPPAYAQFWEIIFSPWDSFKLLLANILYVPLTLLAYLLAWAGRLVNYALQPQPLIISDFVKTGWVAMRDLGNMLFILVLLGIALDYILFNSVGVKRALPRLLFIALIVNFSLPIAGIALDFANISTSFFIERSGGAHFTESLGTRLGLSKVFSAPSMKDAIDAVQATDGVLMDTIFAIILDRKSVV